MKFDRLIALLSAPLALAALPVAAHAQDAAAESEATPAWDLSGEVGVLTDYRFRGLSLSGKSPEVTASASLAHQSGFYASVWASNVELGSGKADDLEADWTVGFSKDVGKINLDVGGVYYSYLGNKDLNGAVSLIATCLHTMEH